MEKRVNVFLFLFLIKTRFNVFIFMVKISKRFYAPVYYMAPYELEVSRISYRYFGRDE